MFAAALRTEPSIFVEDVLTASADLLNAQFEQENFGHRSLIHGHICHNDQLWGVLQPCVFGQPRIWSVEDRATIVTIIDQITAWVMGYVQSHTQAKDLSQERGKSILGGVHYGHRQCVFYFPISLRLL
ncbi:MAG: hypothetical protein HC780_21545 [Leptolyngbyaceae cyanobacterium CSU_1_3]|nr:hypothetical protein [Leptolyngbyaceae cyanobacterium CSU_1_3]